MKIAILGDTHIGARNNSPLFDGYFREFYSEVFFPYIEDNQINTIIQTGDFFDNRKSISMITYHSAMEYLIHELSKYNTYVLVGNHDAPYKNSLLANSPDLFLREYVSVISKATQTEFGLLLPWICAENLEETMRLIKNTTCVDVFGHLELVGFNMHKDYVMEHGMDANIFNKFRNVFSGHYHSKSVKGNITYVGTPVEHSWSDFDDEKGFHIYDTETGELEFIKNPVKIHHKIIYSGSNTENIDQCTNKIIKVIVEDRRDVKAYDKFITRLYAVNPAELQIIDKSIDFSEHDIDVAGTDDVCIEDTMKIINNYIDGIDSHINKDEVKNIFRELHTEVNK